MDVGCNLNYKKYLRIKSQSMHELRAISRRQIAVISTNPICNNLNDENMLFLRKLKTIFFFRLNSSFGFISNAAIRTFCVAFQIRIGIKRILISCFLSNFRLIRSHLVGGDKISEFFICHHSCY